MRTATAPTPGVFCWPELVTTNRARAVEFYTTLFEWRSMDVDGERPYTVFQLDGLNVGAVSAVGPADALQEAHWDSAVSVEDVEAAVARAQELGGRVLATPTDVGELGRKATVEDPCGASIGLWHTQALVNPRFLDSPGALCWSELSTGDIGAAEAFYAGLFGWGSRRDPGNTYIELLRNGDPIAGLLLRRPTWRGVPAQWMPYFSAADVDDTMEVARRHGGGVLIPPATLPMSGRFALLRDPQGARFGIYGVSEAA
jgi:predicted enzyme related to lactoylglutathione lyase